VRPEAEAGDAWKIEDRATSPGMWAVTKLEMTRKWTLPFSLQEEPSLPPSGPQICEGIAQMHAVVSHWVWRTFQNRTSWSLLWRKRGQSYKGAWWAVTKMLRTAGQLAPPEMCRGTERSQLVPRLGKSMSAPSGHCAQTAK
jgi:hypothetical protein